MSVKTRENLTLRWAQGEVFNAKNRFRVLVAGRRFGKSYLSCIELVNAAIKRPGETYFYCAPTYRMAKDIAWKELKKLVPRAWSQSKGNLLTTFKIIENRHHNVKVIFNDLVEASVSLQGSGGITTLTA